MISPTAPKTAILLSVLIFTKPVQTNSTVATGTFEGQTKRQQQHHDKVQIAAHIGHSSARRGVVATKKLSNHRKTA